MDLSKSDESAEREKMKSESAFRDDFMKVCESENVWCRRIEPSKGMKPGIPDLVMQLDKTVFNELKVGEVRKGLLFPREVRPAQFSWHREFNQAGGISFVTVGVENKSFWDCYFLLPNDMTSYEVGIPIENCFYAGQLIQGLVRTMNSFIPT